MGAGPVELPEGLAAWRLDNHFLRSVPADPDTRVVPRQVQGACYSRVSPTPVAAPEVVAFSREVGALLGLTEDDAAHPGFAAVLSGNHLLEGMDPHAACYGGHQFGNWAGQLGDGRAITLGEVATADGRWEVQLKGAGPTPYSRGADGRAVLRSSIREFLCSEAMHHLGIPTTRALSLVSTGDQVVRDMFYDGHPAPEPGAIVARVSRSFLRFGSYQIHASRGDEDTLRTLVDYTIATHFPDLGAPGRDTYLRWLDEVAQRTAHLIAGWMRVGFVHGVMNTDNLSILGETIDYGPYGWIDPFDLEWTPNTTDAGGRRYRFGYQGRIGMWNMARLAEALHVLVPDVPALEGILQTYVDTYGAAHDAAMQAKLGLTTWRGEEDRTWVGTLHDVLSGVETDMTIFFRQLSEVPVGEATDEALVAAVADAFYLPVLPQHHHHRRMAGWLRGYQQRVASQDEPQAVRRARMHAANPKYVLRNYLAQEAIERAEQGDYAGVTELLEVMRRPYVDQPGRDAYAAKRPEWARHKAGCSMLSCSS